MAQKFALPPLYDLESQLVTQNLMQHLMQELLYIIITKTHRFYIHKTKHI